MKVMIGNLTKANFVDAFWSWLGSFCGIAAIALLHYQILESVGLLMLIGSFGASAVLVFGAPQSPLAQPRNLLGGHLLSAAVGVCCFQLFGHHQWFAAAMAVSTAIALMHLSGTMHPPGGATALIAVIGGDAITSLGFSYIVLPVGLGALILLVVGLLVNNLPKNRRYPQSWW